MKVFISGSISIKSLPQTAIQKIDNIMAKDLTVLIGDANGVDRIVQEYLYKNHYQNVIVYYAGQNIRNNIGKWTTENILALGLEGRSKFTLKDIRMAEDSDFGLMIWDGISKGTKNNINKMLNLGKHFYVIKKNEIITDKEFQPKQEKKILQNELFKL